MARIACADGISIQACTPHIQLGVFNNTPDDIRARVIALQAQLTQAGIPLKLVPGCDGHVRHDFVAAIRNNQLLTINETRYVLFEPPHHVAPPHMDSLLFNILAAGYVPVLTHPERLTWIPGQYDLLAKLVRSGVWMQITSGSLTGRFGRGPKALAERLLADGLVHILATDAHSTHRRPPLLREGMLAAAAIVGAEEAERMVLERPRMVIENATATVTLSGAIKKQKRGFFPKIFARA
jgi:protein-tyrosine phosphatase